MKRILRILAIAAICGVLVAPQVEARGNRPSHSQSGGGQRNGGGRNGGRAGGGHTAPSRPGTPSSRPSNGGNAGGARPGNNGGNRPGNPGGNNNGTRPGNNRPGNNGTPGGTRPGNPGNPGGGQRPGNPGHNPGVNPGNRPGNNPGGNHGYRPNNPGGPGHRPGAGPAPRPHRPMHSVPPPHRPHFASPWSAPRPPRGWRPGRLYPTFSTILGITLGTAFDLSLNYLYNNGYSVYSYGNDVVYLSNVNQLNLLWPDATLYYGTRGLDRGEFIYSTSYYDTVRYNEAYARLVAAYGAPVSTSYPSNGMQTCWFGNDGRFVTLQFAPAYGADGVMRYYTTLSFGM